VIGIIFFPILYINEDEKNEYYVKATFHYMFFDVFGAVSDFCLEGGGAIIDPLPPAAGGQYHG